MPKPIALSFFSGAMGLDIGLENSGFDIKLACEIDKHCQGTIKLNHPDLPLIGDVREYNAEQVREISGTIDEDIALVVGGPPCQAFSTAGKRRGLNDERGHVFLDFVQLCIDLNPQYFVIENVRGLLSAPMTHRPHRFRGDDFPALTEDEKRGGALKFVLEMIRNAGYGVSFNLYDSANYGVPQRRERVILICSRDGQIPPFIPPTHVGVAYQQNPIFFGDLGQWVTFEEAVGMPLTGVQKAARELVRRHRLNSPLRHNNRQVSGRAVQRAKFERLKKSTHGRFPESRLRFYRMLMPGQYWKNLPENLHLEALGNAFHSGGGKTGFYRRIAWFEPSPTLVTSPVQKATDLAHPEEDRPLSIEEYARIQMFPDDWKFSGPIGEIYKQIGNAVPVGLGEALGNHILNLIQNNEITEKAGFRYSRYRKTSQEDWVCETPSNRKKSLEALAMGLFVR
ncbi:MAG: DNA cytosine methyltransferase [Candidatus Thermoplasmatota archaeon]|nr:DNA cytosine methyltransferase [Candidatus Thermoplasmatota archaeon]MED5486590.1 DNA cytosine methyltransferase [Candidatus Thermoplasmatota archaeon]